MAISDINRAMGLYAQPSEFDQNAWKTAFDIANNFAISSENNRKNREMLNTEVWRTALANNKNQNEALSAEAIRQAYEFDAANRYDELGRRLNNEEMRNLAWRDPYLNAFAKMAYDKGNVDFLTSMQQAYSPINPYLASEYGVMAGTQNYLVGQDGKITNFHTGNQVGTIADPAMIPQAAANNLWQAYQTQLKSQQEIAEAAAKAEARAAPQYSLIDYRTDKQGELIDKRAANASDKQGAWISHQQASKEWDDIKKMVDESAKNGQDTLLATIKSAGDQYPHLREKLTTYGKAKLGSVAASGF